MASSGSTVPVSKFQLTNQELYHEALAPGTGELHSSKCVILEVYDQETLAETDVPSDIADRIESFPNLLFARVQLDNGRILYRPFKETQSQVFSTYGNSAVLQGAPAKLVFNNARVREGQIVLIDEVKKSPVNSALASEAWDIGLLI